MAPESKTSTNVEHFKSGDYWLELFTPDDFPVYKNLRQQMYGPFSYVRALLYAKTNPRHVVMLHNTQFPHPQAFMTLYSRNEELGSGEEDSWVYQLGYNRSVSVDGIRLLLSYAQSYFKQKGTEHVRILARDSQPKLIEALSALGWHSSGSIAIYEKRDLFNIPFRPSIEDSFELMEADPEKHLPGVQNVDRSAFMVGHRVPKNSLRNHLAEAGSYVVVERSTGDVIGYNYNEINTNAVGHIMRIATIASHRRKGIGAALLANALKWFGNIGVDYLYLRCIPNSAGAKLYESFGFYNTSLEFTFEYKIESYA